jgi:DNA-binding response OmpR family regulator
MKSILVVEDEPAIAFGLQADLVAEGYDVAVVGDGEAAVGRAREGVFDLILLDVMLPRKDGFEVCRELRRAGFKTPILLLTARSQEVEKVMGLEWGADDYVTKPFSPPELRARIKALLRRASSGEEAAYRFGDVEVDFARCELRRSGRTIEMTALELRLLAAFIRNRGRVISRQKLLDEAWGPGTFITDRVVDNHVVALRKKIEAEPHHPRYLISLRGLGYRFDG